MGSKTNPGKFDCYANAEPDEPMFILLGRDKAAGSTVRKWVQFRIMAGKNEAGDEQTEEAMRCSYAMDEYAKASNPPDLETELVEYTLSIPQAEVGVAVLGRHSIVSISRLTPRMRLHLMERMRKDEWDFVTETSQGLGDHYWLFKKN